MGIWAAIQAAWNTPGKLIALLRLARELRKDADARICLGFKRQQEILSEQLREAQARGDTGEEERARQLLHRVQDNELAYHQSRMADLAAHLLADRAPSGLVSPDLPRLPESERAVLEGAARALAALRPALTAAEHLVRGNAFYAAERFDEALEQYDAALALRPHDPDSLNNRGGTLYHLQRYEEALADYNRALDLRPEDRRTLILRGVTLDQLCHHEQALADYDRALQLDPDDRDVLFLRGMTLYHLRRYEEALADYNRALGLRPEDPAVQYAIACLCSLLERYDEALQWLEKAISGNPQNRAVARGDEDFAGLKAHPEFGPRFEKLIQEESS